MTNIINAAIYLLTFSSWLYNIYVNESSDDFSKGKEAIAIHLMLSRWHQNLHYIFKKGKKKMRRLLAGALSALMILALVGCGGKEGGNSDGNKEATNDKVYTLSWAHSSSANGDRLPDASEEIIAEIEEASNGRLVFQHYPASQMGAERETLEGVVLGTVDLAVISTGPIASFFPQIEVSAIPYLITDREIGWQVYDGEFGQMLGKLSEETAGWKWLGWAENGLRMFSNNKHPITCPADMKGLKIRTMENEVHMSIVNSLGAAATPIAASELYTALQQGTVDGQENGIALTYGLGFYEELDYITYLPHIYDPYIVAMNMDTWNSLPTDLQELLQEYINKFCQLEREYNLRDDDAYLQKMIDKGIEVYYPTDAEAQQFIDATSGVVDSIRANVGDELVDAYIKAVDDAKAALNK